MKKALFFLLAGILLAGCATTTPSLAAAPTDTPLPPTNTPHPTDTPLPPTNTPEPSDTPLPPTSTPVPTDTQEPTATPLPPDTKAMIAWKELGLPSEYEAFSPEAMGIQEGEFAYDLTYGGEYKKYNILGSFVFANGEDPDTWIYGYTVPLPTNDDREIFAQLIDDIENFYGPGFTSMENTGGIGHDSKGATGDVGDEKIDTIAFRIRDIGAFVFLRHDPTIDPGIDIKNVAQVYAESIEQPTSYCSITSANAVPDADIPTFDVEAEGFYPQEGRYIKLDGAIELNGETITIATAKLGGTGEMVDPDGSLSDVISMNIKEMMAAKGYKDVGAIEGPIEFTVTVGGHFSGCEATQTVIWP